MVTFGCKMQKKVVDGHVWLQDAEESSRWIERLIAVEEGVLVRLKPVTGTAVIFQPVTGTAVIFLQDLVWHEGGEVTRGEKYLRSCLA